MPAPTVTETLHPVTGRFADARLEAEFSREHFDLSVKRFTRFSVGLSSAVFLAYGLHDALVLPAVRDRAWAVRFGLFTPVAVLVLALAFTPLYARFHQAAMLAFGLTVNLVVVWIGAMAPGVGGAPGPGFFIYTGYSILFVTLGPFIARMNVATQLAYTGFSIALFWVFAARLSHPPAAVAISIGATLAAMGGIGALVARQLEVQAREMFLQRRTIRAQLDELVAERAKSEALLLNILPANVAARLKADGRAIADGFGEVTVLFADIVGFTKLAERLAPVEVVRRLNELFSTFDDLAEEAGGVEKIKTIGDAYMAVAGLSGAPDHAKSMARLALGMLENVAAFSHRYGEPLSIRIGLNTGPVVAGVIGKKKFIYDVWGDTVNTASRMESHGVPGHVHVTEATQRLLAGDYVFESRGDVDVKGKGVMRTYFLVRRR